MNDLIFLQLETFCKRRRNLFNNSNNKVWYESYFAFYFLPFTLNLKELISKDLITIRVGYY